MADSTPYVSPHHRVPDEQWDEVQQNADKFAEQLQQQLKEQEQ